ncbi:unnamed protein product, partial [Brassica rapa]
GPQLEIYCVNSTTSLQKLTFSSLRKPLWFSNPPIRVYATLMDLVHTSVNETVRLNQYQTLSAAMKNTAIESVNKKWEGSKNATLQLVDMECSYLTVDFFRKLSTALRMPSVLLHCGRCDSVQRILLMLRYEIVTASTLANGGLAMKSVCIEGNCVISGQTMNTNSKIQNENSGDSSTLHANLSC